MKKSTTETTKIKTTSSNKVVVLQSIPNLLEDKQRHIQIIGIFVAFKGIKFDSKQQQTNFLKRNLRSARYLNTYSDERLIKIMSLLRDKATFDWQLSTVVKYIDNPNPEKNCFFGKNDLKSSIVFG